MAAAVYTDVTLFRRLLRQARPYWLHIAGVFLVSLLSTPLALLTPLALKIAVAAPISVSNSSPVSVCTCLTRSSIAAARLSMSAPSFGYTTTCEISSSAPIPCLTTIGAFSAWILCAAFVLLGEQAALSDV